jgi:hypothetical protein
VVERSRSPADRVPELPLRVSSTSDTIPAHFAAYPRDVAELFVPKGGLVVEIGSNYGGGAVGGSFIPPTLEFRPALESASTSHYVTAFDTTCLGQVRQRLDISVSTDAGRNAVTFNAFCRSDVFRWRDIGEGSDSCPHLHFHSGKHEGVFGPLRHPDHPPRQRTGSSQRCPGPYLGSSRSATLGGPTVATWRRRFRDRAMCL